MMPIRKKAAVQIRKKAAKAAKEPEPKKAAKAARVVIPNSMHLKLS